MGIQCAYVTDLLFIPLLYWEVNFLMTFGTVLISMKGFVFVDQ